MMTPKLKALLVKAGILGALTVLSPTFISAGWMVWNRGQVKVSGVSLSVPFGWVAFPRAWAEDVPGLGGSIKTTLARLPFSVWGIRAFADVGYPRIEFYGLAGAGTEDLEWFHRWKDDVPAEFRAMGFTVQRVVEVERPSNTVCFELNHDQKLTITCVFGPNAARINYFAGDLAVPDWFYEMVTSAEVSSTLRRTWRASWSNGDKPGVGIELNEDAELTTAKFLVLHPDKPGDFSAGKSFPADVKYAGSSEISFVVHLPGGQVERFAITLDSSLKGERVSATVTGEEGSPRVPIIFVRQ